MQSILFEQALSFLDGNKELLNMQLRLWAYYLEFVHGTK